jgi:hypothetical protein
VGKVDGQIDCRVVPDADVGFYLDTQVTFPLDPLKIPSGVPHQGARPMPSMKPDYSHEPE